MTMSSSLNFAIWYLCCSIILICTLNISPVNSYSISTSNFTRIKRQECNGFLCSSTKECISEDLRCDGNVDCRDGSDEFQDCKDISCPGYLFTCEYGACIDILKKCDGKKDCRDNSDEANCIDTQVAPTEGSNCKSDQFECNSGQCIPLDNKCDGVHNCKDNSDETKATCLNIQCPGYTFKCNYGACVNGYAKCDGVKDCVDNSDEEDCGVSPVTVPSVTPPTDSGPGICTLPPHPVNGNWSIVGGFVKAPGQRVTDQTLLMFSCNDNYKVTTENVYILCSKNGWTKTFPECAKLCEPIFSSDTVKVMCYDSKKNEIPCKDAIDGATATFECAPYYESVDDSNRRYCFRGTWDNPPPQCKPVCGEKHVTAEPLIVSGKKVERGNYPWVTALFVLLRGEYVNACGGTMLTQRVVLTAAHCVANVKGEVALPLSAFKIAVGKYFNKYLDERDTEAQYSDIEEIIVHRKYRGDDQRFTSDIAFLITKDKLAYSKVVQPVCFVGLNSNTMKLPSNTAGTVAGWGYTVAGGKPSDTLQEVEVFYKDDITCRRELPTEWGNKYFGYDKFCAGHFNKSIAVCKGDSGSGFVVQGRNDRYFVHGIVSLSHKTEEGCDIQLSALYTSVAEHYDMLEEITARYAN